MSSRGKNKNSSKKSNNNRKSNKRSKSKSKKVTKHKKSYKKYTGDKSCRHISSVEQSIKARQEKKKQKKKKKSQRSKKDKNLKPSIYTKKKTKSSKKKLKKKTKNKKSNKSQKTGTDKRRKDHSDRLYKQRERDIEMAKNRLHKKRTSSAGITIQQSTLQIPLNNRLKVPSIHNRNVSKLTNKKLWRLYITKFGNKPPSASHLQRFSQTSSNYKTLSFKEANTLFEKYNCDTVEEKDGTDSNSASAINRQAIQRMMLKSNSYYMQDEIKQNDDNKMDLNENKRKSKSTKAIVEIKAFIESERIYVYEGLNIGLNTFLNRLDAHNEINKSIISEKDIHLIFTNYHTLYNINSKLYNDLKELSLHNGVNKLIYSFGELFNQFIPYFKLYIDYIVHKQAAITHLEHLKKTNKAFKRFLKINEHIAKTKLKLLLEEPAHRIAQYLEYLVNIYTSYKHEATANSKGEKLLLQSIAEIKQVSDQIAIKCRDIRSRLLVGTLQIDYFGNKIKLLSAHRFCIAYSSVEMLLNDKDKIKCYKFILLNDIFLISSFPSKFKSAQLKAVYPLIGLRISRNIDVPLLASQGFKILLLPANIVIIFNNQSKMDKWINIIKNAVDKQEHCMKRVNVIDLEKRVRKQKTSKEGENETIAITNPQQIKAIQKWKKNKTSSFASIPKLQKKTPTKSRARRSKTFGGMKKKQKSILSRITSFKSSNSDDIHEIKSNNQKTDKVRVMRDEEVLQFDEEIPMENFMKALNDGFVKITNDEEQNEQYKKAANTAKKLVDSSLQSYRASVFSDHWSSSDSDDDWD